MDKRWQIKKAKAALENYQHPDHYGQWMGYQVTSVDLKRFVARAEMQLREDHLSPAGKVHGGVIAGFLDFSCGAAVFTTLKKSDFCSTVELKVNYFKPLLSGDKLKSISEVLFRGKRLCVVHSFLYRKGEKDAVAVATATFNVVSKSK
jgi:uncharacterized protein (TIGR00369 family)